VYSGHVAAEAYALLKDKHVDRVVVLSPSHVDAFEGVAIYDGDAYSTPLGKIKVDKNFTNRLASSHRLINLSSRGHETTHQGRGEHALEVQLPYLQRVLKEFKIVPVIMGDQTYETCRILGRALASLIDDDKTIIVASSDLSHFHSYNEAKQLDSKVVRTIQEWDYYNLSRNFQSRLWEACGGGPIVTTMIAAEMLGATEAKLLKYANSGDVLVGDKSRVVGYTSFAFIKAEKSRAAKNKTFRLSEQEQKRLMKIAKESVHSYIRDNQVFEIENEQLPNLLQERGAFVTLKIKNRLRGCIGYTSPVKPLNQTVRDVAIQAAAKDPRFRPVTMNELNLLDYEISVLSPFRKVLDIKNIKVGKHGLLIKKDQKAGLLLPQVPVEQNWDRVTFLEQTCQKAGLPSNAWEEENTDVFQFTAFVFGDHD
jgi:AmmeMemoRadiSam system protein B/AmmeMemoRadiSam system protein A